MATELDFANKFVQLLEVTTPSTDAQQQFADSFKLSKITKLPANFTFPPLPHPYGTKSNNAVISHGEPSTNDLTNTEGENDAVERGVEFTFKSLKQPKFNLTAVLDIKPTTNIYMLKTSLSHLLEYNEDIGIIVEPSNIKLMIRTKTLQDSENVFHVLENAGLSDKLALNVLIAQFRPKEKEIPTEQVTTADGKTIITDESWKKISDILLNDLKNQELVDKTILGFKNSL